MPLFTENQLTGIVAMIMDDYGFHLKGDGVSEVIGLVLENISGFEPVDSQILNTCTPWLSYEGEQQV
jgi:hypothetical protein